MVRELGDRRPWFVRLTHQFGRIVIPAMTHVHLEGLDRPDLPRTGPLIVASNHISNADPALIGSWVSPALGRQLHWLGKEESLRWPLLGWAIAENGVIGVRRGTGDIEAFRLARRVLDEGYVLVVFPEGTRSRTASLQAAKDGIAILALRTGAPILPIGIHGTEHFWPRGKLPWFRGGDVTLRVGAPFRIPAPTGGDRKAAQHEATATIMRRIAELLPPAYRGAYAGAVDDAAGDQAGDASADAVDRVSAPRVT
jgi:1-acyl-sn-glycerol-3-phosphate acyltransferase